MESDHSMAEPSSNTPSDTRNIVHLRLYMAGNAPNSVRALANLERICRDFIRGEYNLEIIDVWNDPQRALADRVYATPMLKRLSPTPEVVILGDLHEIDSVVFALGLDIDPR